MGKFLDMMKSSKLDLPMVIYLELYLEMYIESYLVLILEQS